MEKAFPAASGTGKASKTLVVRGAPTSAAERALRDAGYVVDVRGGDPITRLARDRHALRTGQNVRRTSYAVILSKGDGSPVTTDDIRLARETLGLTKQASGDKASAVNVTLDGILVKNLTKPQCLLLSKLAKRVAQGHKSAYSADLKQEEATAIALEKRGLVKIEWSRGGYWKTPSRGTNVFVRQHTANVHIADGVKIT